MKQNQTLQIGIDIFFIEINAYSPKEFIRIP
jgi:hypothetical protein